MLPSFRCRFYFWGTGDEKKETGAKVLPIAMLEDFPAYGWTESYPEKHFFLSYLIIFIHIFSKVEESSPIHLQ
jgi:hypothetical protein